jgi:hypothetical protein
MGSFLIGRSGPIRVDSVEKGCGCREEDGLIQSRRSGGTESMMGSRRGEQGELFYDFSLDRHVPRGHLLRSFDRIRQKHLAMVNALSANQSALHITCGHRGDLPHSEKTTAASLSVRRDYGLR